MVAEQGDRPTKDSASKEPPRQARSPRSARPSQRRRGRRGRGAGAKLPDGPVVLVGPMAAGKTSLGKRLARELGVPFVDSDALIVRAHGPITEIFAERGEAEFRRIENEVIERELAEAGPRVVALGGGAVLHEGTRRLLRRHPVILLMTTQRAVLGTVNISRRPLLRDDPNAWGRILEERRPLYEEVADVTFRTDRSTKEQLTRRVSHWVRSRSNTAGASPQKEEPPV